MRLNSILFCLCLTAAVNASAQETPFINGEPVFSSPAGAGVLRGPASHPKLGEIGPDEIAVDNTGDGLVDAIHDIPAEILQGNGFDLDFRLSPSQQVLFTVKSPSGSAPVCNGNAANVLVYFHRLDTPPATTVLASSVCLRAPLSIGPLFYDPGPSATVRTAVLVAAPFPGGSGQAVLWVDLVSGGFNLDSSTYSANVMPTPGGIQFAADGRAAFVDHGEGAVFRRFSMIDLCRSRVAAVAAGAVSSGALGSGIAQAWTVDLGGGTVQAEVRLDGVAQPGTRITLDDCSTPPPQTWSLDVVVEGSGIGSVASIPIGIDCPPDCQNVYEDNETVTLNAVAESGSSFEGWSGDCSGTTTPVQVTMTADLTCTANFFRPTADLRVSMSDSPDPVVAGETLNLSVTASNDGPEPASNVSVQLTLPDGTTFTGASPDGLCFGTTSANCSIGNLPAGGSTSFSVQAAVAPDQRAALETIAEISGQPVDPNGSNDQAITLTDVIAEADLSLNKQVAPDPGGAGNLVVYTLEVDNAGPSSATGVTLQDTFPAGLSALSGDPSLSCGATPIPPGGGARFQVIARIDSSVAPGTILTNQAAVSAVETDPVGGNNTASVDLLVQTGSPPPSGEFVPVAERGTARPGGGTFDRFVRAAQSGSITAFHHFDVSDPFTGTGHWLAVEGVQVPIVDGNSPVPGRTTDFLLFRSDDPSMDGITGVFSAQLDDVGWGVYRYDGCAIRRLFDDSTVEVFVFTPRFLEQAGDTVAFISGTRLYRWNGSTVETLVDLATPLPSGNGNGLFSGVFSLSYDGGPIFFIATGGALSPDPPVEIGLYAWSDGIITPVATTDTPIPGGTGTFADFDRVGMTLSADGDDVVFRGVNDAGERGIYARIDGVLQRVVDASTPIPGGTGTFEYLGEGFPSTSSISEPSLSNGRVAFVGKNDDADASNLGAWVWDNGVIEPVLLPGDEAAGRVVDSVQLGRRGLDGKRLAIVAQLIEPDGTFGEAVLVTELTVEELFSDGFEPVSGF